jgi:Transglycosylase SLT domain/SPOR domain
VPDRWKTVVIARASAMVVQLASLHIVTVLTFLLIATNVGAEVSNSDASPDDHPLADDLDVLPDQKSGAEKELCELVRSASTKHGIPSVFFTRLLWKESRFHSDALSPKGAQGIAQFMPDTAAERGLLDPFDIRAAIPASASYLADLKAQFGNLGLATAAYNAGPARVSNWLAQTSSLPWETQDFVMSITETEAETWAASGAIGVHPVKDDKEQDCMSVVTLLKIPNQDLGPAVATSSGPWGVQVGGNFYRARILKTYQRLQSQYPTLIGGKPPMVIGTRLRGPGTRIFYRARVPMQTRKEADQLCAQIKAAGGACIVLKT